jgi:hypothetical protein
MMIRVENHPMRCAASGNITQMYYIKHGGFGLYATAQTALGVVIDFAIAQPHETA